MQNHVQRTQFKLYEIALVFSLSRFSLVARLPNGTIHHNALSLLTVKLFN